MRIYIVRWTDDDTEASWFDCMWHESREKAEKHVKQGFHSKGCTWEILEAEVLEPAKGEERVMLFRATQSATRRTRNKLHKHGSEFEIKGRQTPQCIGEECYYLRAPDGWYGWIPTSEIEPAKGEE